MLKPIVNLLLRNKPLVCILLVAIALRIVLHLTYTAWWVADSAGYTNPFVFFFGSIEPNLRAYDGIRTPLYPFFLGLIAAISQSQLTQGSHIDPHCANAVIIAQSLLGLIGIFYVYKTLVLLAISKRIQFWATLFYALTVPVLKYETIILSESLTTFMVILSIYFFVKLMHYAKDDNPAAYWTAAFAGLINGLAALARPNTLILSSVFLMYLMIFAILQYIHNRQRCYASLPTLTVIATFTGIVPLVCWMIFVFGNTGAFTMTPMTGFTRSHTAYNLFDRVHPQDKLLGDIMVNQYRLVNVHGVKKQDYLYQVLPKISSVESQLPLIRKASLNYSEINSLSGYIGYVSRYLLWENPTIWWENGWADFKDTFHMEDQQAPLKMAMEPISPTGGSVIRHLAGWRFLNDLNHLETVPLLFCYLLMYGTLILSATQCLKATDITQGMAKLLPFSLALAGIVSFIAPCFLAAFYPRYGVPFYGLMIMCSAYVINTMSEMPRPHLKRIRN